MSVSARSSIFWFALLLCACAVTLAVDPAIRNDRALLTDFRAFYCAGSVRLAGADPYLVEPLRRCEHAAVVGSNQAAPPAVVVPAPLPGYDLALFALLGRLPFGTAAILWELAAVGAIGLTIVMLNRLTGLEPEVIFATLLLSEGVAALFFGQLVPFSIAALAVAMFAVSRKRFGWAALATTFSLIEPHLGIGAWLALLLFAPRARAPLILWALVLALISLAANGVAGNLEYLHRVVPAHVLSEVNNDDQYSLTSLVRAIGAGDALAVRIGEISYLFALGLGLWCAGTLARRANEDAYLIALPTAFVLVGGPFVHIHQMAAALLATLLLFARLPARRAVFGTASFLLAIPWIHLFLLMHLRFALIVVVMLLAARLLRLPLLGQVCLTVVVLAAVFLSNLFFNAPSTPIAALAPSDATALAENFWRAYIDARHTSNHLLFLLLKVPTWSALLMTAGWAVICAVHGGREARNATAA